MHSIILSSCSALCHSPLSWGKAAAMFSTLNRKCSSNQEVGMWYKGPQKNRRNSQIAEKACNWQEGLKGFFNVSFNSGARNHVIC